MDIRPYVSTDRNACLALFDSNVPDFFDASERKGFADFLDSPNCAYFVMEHDDAVVGCGGYAIDGEVGSMVWGMVRRDSQKLGLGRFLLLYRVRKISKAGSVGLVRLATSQRTASFFEKQGFKATRVVKDGFAPGIDRVEMVMKLNVCP
ncbi:MAG: GNAT family N-acetyltransferase [Bryobacteraceae bacterium]